MTQREKSVKHALEQINKFVGRFESHRCMWVMPCRKDWTSHSYHCFRVSDPKMRRQPFQFLLFVIHNTGGWDVLIDAAESTSIDKTFQAIMDVPSYA